MSAKKSHGHEGTAPESPSYDEVIAEIAAGVKTLTEAGMGASSAGELACKVWCMTNGVPCPVDPPAAE